MWRRPCSTLFPYTTLFRSTATAALVCPGGPAPRAGGRLQHPVRARSATTRPGRPVEDRKSTRLNSSHLVISYAVFCLKKKRLIHDECECVLNQGSVDINLN